MTLYFQIVETAERPALGPRLPDVLCILRPSSYGFPEL